MKLSTLLWFCAQLTVVRSAQVRGKSVAGCTGTSAVKNDNSTLQTMGRSVVSKSFRRDLRVRHLQECPKEESLAESKGYHFVPSFISHGNGLRHIKGKTVDQIEVECRKRFNCVAFRSDGWLLTEVSEESKWENMFKSKKWKNPCWGMVRSIQYHCLWSAQRTLLTRNVSICAILLLVQPRRRLLRNEGMNMLVVSSQEVSVLYS